jgi:hypothetical protein
MPTQTRPAPAAEGTPKELPGCNGLLVLAHRVWLLARRWR